MVLEPTVVLVGAVNLVALGAAYGSLRQSVQECCRRITRLEDSNGKKGKCEQHD